MRVELVAHFAHVSALVESETTSKNKMVPVLAVSLPLWKRKFLQSSPNDQFEKTVWRNYRCNEIPSIKVKNKGDFFIWASPTHAMSGRQRDSLDKRCAQLSLSFLSTLTVWFRVVSPILFKSRNWRK